MGGVGKKLNKLNLGCGVLEHVQEAAT